MTRKLTAKTIENLKPGPQRREISDGGSGLWLVLQSSGAKSWAVINVTDNVRGDLSAHVITVSELNRQKIARAIECDGHDAESVGIIDTTDIVRRDHSLYLTVAKDISSPQSENKKRAIPILKCAARSIRLIRYRPAAPPAPRNRIRANADNRKASRTSLFERLGSRTVAGEPQGEDEATVLLINTYRTPVSGVFRRKDSGFAVCGENPASVSQFVAGIRHGSSGVGESANTRQNWLRSRLMSFSLMPMQQLQPRTVAIVFPIASDSVGS